MAHTRAKNYDMVNKQLTQLPHFYKNKIENEERYKLKKDEDGKS